MASRQVDDGTGDKERRNLARTSGQHRRMLTLNYVEATDARADMHAHTVAIRLVDLEAGVIHGLLCGGNRKMDKPPHLARLFFVDEKQRVKVLDLCGKAHGVAFKIECLDRCHSATACEQALPDFRRGFTDPADEADSGNDDSTSP